MNDDQTFERNARLWLEIGPAHVPTRVVDAALRTIATTPQERSLRAPWRTRVMRTPSRLAFVAAIAVAVIALGGGYLLFRNSQSQVALPAPSPTAMPTASVDRVPLNAPSPVSMQSLQSMWASVGTRSAPAGLVAFGQVMNIDQAGLHIDTLHAPVTSATALSAAGALMLEVSTSQSDLDMDQWDCHAGDSGSYGLTMSSDDQTLTLSSNADDCATREAILAGSWTRWPCKLNYGGYAYCRHPNELVPGRHVSSVFKPFAGGQSGQFAWTTTDSWVTLSKPPTWPDADNSSSATWLNGPPGADVVGVFSDLVPSTAHAVPDSDVPTATCSDGIHASGGTAAEIADWLESLPYLAVSNRVQVTIGGLRGVQLDVSLRGGFIDPCSTHFTSADGTVQSARDIQIFNDLADPSESLYLNDSSPHGPRSGPSARIIVLDSGDANRNIVIEIPAPPDGSPLDASMAGAMPLIDSFEFTR